MNYLTASALFCLFTCSECSFFLFDIVVSVTVIYNYNVDFDTLSYIIGNSVILYCITFLWSPNLQCRGLSTCVENIGKLKR